MKVKLNSGTIILLTLLFIVFAFVGYMLSSRKLTSNYLYETEIAQIESQGDSDSPESIESDLNDTELEGLDQELTDIEAELNSTSSY